MRTLLECFTTPHRPGELLQALNPRWGSRLGGAQLHGVIERIQPTGVDAATVHIRPGHGWRAHRPGQFVTLGVDVRGIRHHRCFTITSVPGSADGRIQVTVQAHPGGLVSDHLVHRARPGDVVALAGPSGEPALQARADEPVLFVSGGSGLTPVMGMLRALATDAMWSPLHDPSEHLDVVVLHHVVSESHLLFGGELAALAAAMPWLRVELVVTRDEQDRSVPGTHLDPGRLDLLCPDWRGRHALVCGPRSMLEVAEHIWSEAGLRDRLRVESFDPLVAVLGSGASDSASDSDSGAAFGSASDSAPEGTKGTDGPGHGATTTAELSRTGRTVVAGPTTPLLEVAEEAGACPASGCRMGICHTCITELTAGSVVDLRDGRRSSAGQHVQLCVSAALTDVVLTL